MPPPVHLVIVLWQTRGRRKPAPWVRKSARAMRVSRIDSGYVADLHRPCRAEDHDRPPSLVEAPAAHCHLQLQELPSQGTRERAAATRAGASFVPPPRTRARPTQRRGLKRHKGAGEGTRQGQNHDGLQDRRGAWREALNGTVCPFQPRSRGCYHFMSNENDHRHRQLRFSRQRSCSCGDLEPLSWKIRCRQEDGGVPWVLRCRWCIENIAKPVHPDLSNRC